MDEPECLALGHALAEIPGEHYWFTLLVHARKMTAAHRFLRVDDREQLARHDGGRSLILRWIERCHDYDAIGYGGPP